MASAHIIRHGPVTLEGVFKLKFILETRGFQAVEQIAPDYFTDILSVANRFQQEEETARFLGRSPRQLNRRWANKAIVRFCHLIIDAIDSARGAAA